MLPCRLSFLTLLSLVGSGFLFAGEPSLRNRIDEQIQAAWKREKLTPVGPAADAVFLRRIYLDLVGVIPTLAETQEFLQSNEPDKRSKLIDRLLLDPRFADKQANVWDQVLFGRNPPNGDATRERSGFTKWLRDKFARNEPYDRWVRELLQAEGNTIEHGAPLFYVQYRAQPEETMVAVSRLFLGTQLQCAQCHNHPHESWTQEDFFGMAAFFARLVVVDSGNKKYIVAEKRTGEVLFTGPAIDQKPGQKGTPVGAKFLGGAALTEPPLPKDYKEPAKGSKTLPKPDFSRKEKLAAWLTAPENPYFARAVANRIWGQFMRRGLVHPVDNLSATNRASHPELLEILEAEIKAHKFDLQWYIRELVNSETYQMASRGPTAEPFYFEQARLRPLTAEELLASWRVAINLEKSKLNSSLENYTMRIFGSPTDGRGDFQASLNERLFINNNGYLRQMIQRNKDNLADTLLASTDSWEQKVDRMYLTILNRPPSSEERQHFVTHLTSNAMTSGLLEEAIWALVASAEFRFNH